MTATDIKNDLHRLVVETDDLDILQTIQQVFTAMKRQQPDWWTLLSDSQQRLVKTSLEQAEENNLTPSVQVHDRISTWIKAKS